jgi:hypothetical protein
MLSLAQDSQPSTAKEKKKEIDGNARVDGISPKSARNAAAKALSLRKNSLVTKVKLGGKCDSWKTLMCF